MAVVKKTKKIYNLIMEAVRNLTEFIDELFPVQIEKRNFFTEILNEYKTPAKYLGFDCAQGALEHQLSKIGYDVTGIEQNDEVLRLANLRRRDQLMSIRFFKMNIDEVQNFLGKKFYNVASSLGSRILFHSESQIGDLFSAVKALLSDNGKFIVETVNLEPYKNLRLMQFEPRKSIRVSLYSEILANENFETGIFTMNLENSSGETVPILKDIPVNLITKDKLVHIAQKTGFSKMQFYSDWNKSAFTGSEQTLIAEFSV